MSSTDLGNQLLECAKKGQTSAVHNLLCRGATFNSEWVCFVHIFNAISIKFKFIVSIVSIVAINDSLVTQHYIMLLKMAIMKYVNFYYGPVATKMQEQKLDGMVTIYYFTSSPFPA